MNSFFSESELAALGLKSFGTNVLISRKTSIYGVQNISLGDNVRIDDFCVLSGKIEIGNYVHLATSCLLFAGTAGITMKDFSGLSSRTAIYAMSDDYSGEYMTNPTVPAEYRSSTGAQVVLGRHVVVGSGSTILPGVQIGDGCSFGAMSLIAKSTEPWGIYVGAPCKRIKERSQKLLEFEKNSEKTSLALATTDIGDANMSLKAKIKQLREDLRASLVTKKRRAVANSLGDFTIFASNCIGGRVYHDLKMRFSSPLINMALLPEDYLRFVENPRHYIDKPMVDITKPDNAYPVARIDDITLRLVHYESVAQAQKKWDERKARIVWDKIYYIMTDKDNCTREHMERFDRLPSEHKVLFTHLPYPDIACAFYVKGFEKEKSIGAMLRYSKIRPLRMKIDQFDWAKWFK